MGLKIEKWGAFEGVGDGYGFHNNGKFYAVLETKVGSYRGNHIHPYDQHTILLEGKASYIKFDGRRVYVPLCKGETVTVNAGVPHILNVEEDCLTFEWWDGEFLAEDCTGYFEDITRDRIGIKRV
ncbi:hypothetical protein KEJ47_01455 [Candidatus Bathyarchaeota archaeon]|nr:hypothetical protein [Candidatus Bathyarchaeota archaeon]